MKPTRFQKVARSARGFILYDLLYILGPTWPQFYRFWKQFWHRLLLNVLAIAARHGTHAENLQKTGNSNGYQTLAAKHSTNAISKHSTNAISTSSMQNTCRELAKNLRKTDNSKRSPRNSAGHFEISETRATCNKPQAIKSGGGGVRAAWRIRILIRT